MRATQLTSVKIVQAVMNFIFSDSRCAFPWVARIRGP